MAPLFVRQALAPDLADEARADGCRKKRSWSSWEPTQHHVHYRRGSTLLHLEGERRSPGQRVSRSCGTCSRREVPKRTVRILEIELPALALSRFFACCRRRCRAPSRRLTRPHPPQSNLPSRATVEGSDETTASPRSNSSRVKTSTSLAIPIPHRARNACCSRL